MDADTKNTLVRQYERSRHLYEKLVEEVLFGLRARLEENKIVVAATLGRAKTSESFAKKIERKRYEKLSEVPDLAGVRVVCLYESQIEQVADLLRRPFQILGEQNKTADLGTDRMGYHGLHLAAKLVAVSGPRYDDLRGLSCEIQIRTVLQDAWALISHHLVYKDEDAVPARLRRDLNNVMSLLEVAQGVFDAVQEKRVEYIQEIQSSLPRTEEFLARDLDFDTLTEYSKWKYPDLPVSDDLQAILLSDLVPHRYQSLGDLDKVVETAGPAVAVYSAEMPSLFRFSTDYLTKSLGFVDQDFRKLHTWCAGTKKAFTRHAGRILEDH